MKHLKIYEDYWETKPESHKDDQLFDKITELLPMDFTFKTDDGYFIRDDNGFNQEKTEKNIKWYYRNDKYINFSIKKIMYYPKNITDPISKPDKYECEIFHKEKDVSQEKLKNYFNKLEVNYDKLQKERRIEWNKDEQEKELSIIKKKENDILKKATDKYNL